MASYSLSERAAADIAEIYEFTIANFGLAKAREYVSGLHGRLELLVENPALGRVAEELFPALRRSEYESHVVFYAPVETGAYIVRVLHQSMDAQSHFGEGWSG